MQHKKMTPERFEEVFSLVVQIYPTIKRLCEKFYGQLSKDFRTDYFSGKFGTEISREDQAQLERLQALETEILQHNVPMCHALSRKFFSKNRTRMPVFEYDDYFQESLLAVLNCVYVWNGSTEFITYATTAIRNALLNFVRQNASTLKSASSKTSDRLLMIKSQIALNNCSFEEAVDLAGLKLKPKQIARLRSAMSIVLNEGAIETRHGGNTERSNNLESIAIDRRELPVDQLPMIREIFDVVQLSEFQKELLWALMSGEVGYQTRLAEEHGISKSLANYHLRQAKEKLREHFAFAA